MGRYGEMRGGMREAPVGRMLRLLLSDGAQRVVALEYSRLRDLSTLTPIGAPLPLSPPLTIALVTVCGCLSLRPHTRTASRVWCPRSVCVCALRECVCVPRPPCQLSVPLADTGWLLACTRLPAPRLACVGIVDLGSQRWSISPHISPVTDSKTASVNMCCIRSFAKLMQSCSSEFVGKHLVYTRGV